MTHQVTGVGAPSLARPPCVASLSQCPRLGTEMNTDLGGGVGGMKLGEY